ncbi:hypothetical protein KLP28_13740 [Nocardioidaceae bacterium]|nr:hypothetical protein KLP28_13740 [Nocardioidaceae bacterium]
MNLYAVTERVERLLREAHEQRRADWLAERRERLEDPAKAAPAANEIRGIVHGMGGLLDLWPDVEDRDHARRIRNELHDLAERIIELTDPSASGPDDDARHA